MFYGELEVVFLGFIFLVCWMGIYKVLCIWFNNYIFMYILCDCNESFCSKRYKLFFLILDCFFDLFF